MKVVKIPTILGNEEKYFLKLLMELL